MPLQRFILADNLHRDHVEHALRPPDLHAEVHQIRSPDEAEDDEEEDDEEEEFEALHLDLGAQVVLEVPDESRLETLDCFEDVLKHLH